MSIAARFKAQAIYVPYTMEVIHSYTAIEKKIYIWLIQATASKITAGDAKWAGLTLNLMAND